MQAIGVECSFSAEGAVQVRRIQLEGRWQSVGQGRQWLDENGRHVLIMLPPNQTREIVLRPQSLNWELVPARGASTSVA